MVTTGILPYKENSHGRAGNRTRDLVVSSQKLWSLDHEAGRKKDDDVVWSGGDRKGSGRGNLGSLLPNRQCTLRAVHEIVVALEKEYYVFWARVCSLSYPACNAHAPYRHLWPVWRYRIFQHYLINGTIFGKKKLLNIKCVFWFSVQFLSEKNSHSKKNSARYYHKCRSSCKVPFILVRF